MCSQRSRRHLSLAKKDAALCLIDTHLKEAGVLVVGHRIKIINALVDGLPESVADFTPTVGGRSPL